MFYVSNEEDKKLNLEKKEILEKFKVNLIYKNILQRKDEIWV